MNATPVFYTEEEAAEILQVKTHQLMQERRKGRIKPYRIIGERIRYTPEMLEQYVKNHPLNEKKYGVVADPG